MELVKSKHTRILFYISFGIVFTSTIFVLDMINTLKNPLYTAVSKIFMEEKESDLVFLASKNFTLDELSDFFIERTKEKGAHYAYELLGEAKFKTSVDMHLVAHAIGNELFELEGIDGIRTCTQDFGNGCSHAIVIAAFQEEGAVALSKISEACKSAPGAKGAYMMCYHGLGHGVVSYASYDMKKTAEYCRMAGTKEKNYKESDECMGGAIMEIISGGGHDKDLWEQERPRLLNPDHPFDICTSDVMTGGAPHFCVMYLVPYLFEIHGGSIGRVDASEIKTAFQECEKLNSNIAYLKGSCYGSFGKEFPKMANNLDIRELWKMSDASLSRVYDMCKLAGNQYGTQMCIQYAVGALLWGGENDISGAVRLCNLIDDVSVQEICANEAINSTYAFTPKGDQKRRDLCEKIDLDYQDQCRVTLLE